MASHLSDRSSTSGILIDKRICQQQAKQPGNMLRPSISSDCAIVTGIVAAGTSADPVPCLQSKRTVSTNASHLQSSQDLHSGAQAL